MKCVRRRKTTIGLRALFLLVVSFLIQPLAFAERLPIKPYTTSESQFRQIDLDVALEGKSSLSVNSVTESTDGSLWISTDRGLWVA
jgi:hypothetical protein